MDTGFRGASGSEKPIKHCKNACYEPVSLSPGSSSGGCVRNDHGNGAFEGGFAAAEPTSLGRGLQKPASVLQSVSPFSSARRSPEPRQAGNARDPSG